MTIVLIIQIHQSYNSSLLLLFCRVSLDKMDVLDLLDLVDQEDSLESWDSLDLRELL